MRLTFLGAAGTVTGSKFLLESGRTRILIDCGLFQGFKPLRLRNWAGPPVEPSALDAIVLTHAHLDHSGYLPVMVRKGFRGPIHATPPTEDLCGILLPDSGRIQEEDAKYANRKRFSKHKPALPLYTEREAIKSLRSIEAVPFGSEWTVGEVTLRYIPAGHILGAASVLAETPDGRILFSGDLGQDDDLLMRPPAPLPEADWIVMESTYGSREHAETDRVTAVGEVLERTVGRGGILLVPSFAVGRAQTFLYVFHRLFRRPGMPRVPLFLNSPMATDVTELYVKYHEYHKLTEGKTKNLCAGVTFVNTVEESKRLAARRKPCVIVSASGMATGGRVLHHLRALAPDGKNTILMPGYQAPGTRGDRIARGEGSIKIHGRYVPVRAEVAVLDAFSAHADRRQLLDWLGAAPKPPREVFLVHGEPAAADALRVRIGETLGFPVTVPEYGQSVTLGETEEG